MRANELRRYALLGLPLAAAVFALLGGTRTAHGDGVDENARAKAERCAIRLSGAILGQSPSRELIGSDDPARSVDAMLQTPEFYERFARYFNARSNRQRGSDDHPGEDGAYYLVKHVLQKNAPWADTFVGPYTVDDDGSVRQDPAGLGYFRSNAWMTAHAGNDPSGLRLSSAYRMLQNVVGLKLAINTNSPNATVEERSAEGRKRAECAGCHYENWYALDKVAAVLSRRQGGGGKPITFTDPPGGYTPQNVVDGTISNDKELLDKLVASENFSFNACRVAFEFLNGREENTCEGQLLDQCVDVFKEKRTMQSAIAFIAKDPGYCQ